MHSILRRPGRVGGADIAHRCAENIWPRFVTVFHEDQDLLRKAASERNYRSLYCTNYTGSSATPLQYPSGRAEEYSM